MTMNIANETWLGYFNHVLSKHCNRLAKIDMTKHRQAVVFSSGGVISVAVGKVLLGLNAKQIFALNWSIANASITTLRWTDGRFAITEFNGIII